MSTASPSSVSLRGVFPPLTTPFNADESVAWDKLAENVQRLNGTKVAGVLVQGSNGECYSLTTDERVEMVKQV